MAYGLLVPWPGIEPRLLAVKEQNPNHWTIREFPKQNSFELKQKKKKERARLHHNPASFLDGQSLHVTVLQKWFILEGALVYCVARHSSQEAPFKPSFTSGGHPRSKVSASTAWNPHHHFPGHEWQFAKWEKEWWESQESNNNNNNNNNNNKNKTPGVL